MASDFAIEICDGELALRSGAKSIHLRADGLRQPRMSVDPRDKGAEGRLLDGLGSPCRNGANEPIAGWISRPKPLLEDTRDRRVALRQAVARGHR
jgi:hypothetical protein